MEARRERKIVTVLFADLVGFTSQAEQLDPEDVEALLRPYHQRLREELERYGGTVEKFIGDAVMALFGAPTAHEDDPERAVRAALAIRDWAREKERVQVRIAVNTGEALVNLGARPESGEGMASGDVVNTTARLQAAAPVNGVLVGASTYRATRNTIDYREADPVEAKGKAAPVEVWEVVEARSRVTTEPVTLAVPLVGRERELSLLEEVLVRVREESSPQLVTIVGVPGIGKTRLIYEVFRAVEHGGVLTYWRQGRSLPYGESVTFRALAEIVKAQAGILETDGREDVEAKLRAAVENLAIGTTDGGAVEQHLRPLVGLPAEDAWDEDSRTEVFAAWRRFFESMAEQRPLVLVFEDLQWADDGLLDFVDHLVDWSGRLPMLMFCTARPELLERRPGWGGGKLNSTTLSLSPLSDEDTARLFAELLEAPLLEAGRQQALLARAGGNPLYAEQFAQLVADGVGDPEGQVPENVQGIIAARLDHLPVEEKSLLQDAAVLGKIFWSGGLAGAGSTDVESRLHALERKGFVQRARRTSVAGQLEYAFLHALVREVAYGQIPRAERAKKHRRAAEWIESLARTDDHAEMLAHHYRTALELERTAGIDSGDLEPRARAALRLAGDRAAALNAFTAAAGFYDEALALWPLEDREGRATALFGLGRALHRAGDSRRIEALDAARDALLGIGDVDRAADAEALQAEAWWFTGQRERGLECLQRAEELLRDREPSAAKARVLGELARFHMVGGRPDQAIQVGGEAIAIAKSLGLEEAELATLVTVGSARSNSGDLSGDDDLRLVMERSRQLNFSKVEWRAINNLGSSFTQDRGLVRETRPLLEEGIARAEQLGDRDQISWFRTMLAFQTFWEGRLDDVVRYAELVLVPGEEHYTDHSAYQLRARVRLARNDLAGAEGDIERALARVRDVGEPQALNPTLSSASLMLAALDRRDEARALVAEVLDHVQARRGSPNANTAFLALSAAAVELGLGSEFLEATEAVELDTPWLAASRVFAAEEFGRAAELIAPMSSVDEAWARLRAAGQLAASGRRAEADAQLATALAFYRSVGATYYVRMGETLLAASA